LSVAWDFFLDDHGRLCVSGEQHIDEYPGNWRYSGFIGSNFIRFVLSNKSEVTILNLDALTYAGARGTTEAEDLESDFKGRYRFVQGDIADFRLLEQLFDRSGFDGILNFAAESHVDRSITDPTAFIRTNVFGTGVLLEAARKHRVQRFLQVSTDEVYGSLGPKGKFTEKTPLDPSSPYSASKAGADHLVLALAERLARMLSLLDARITTVPISIRRSLFL
jgi:dTDP-glucose 4,6-dehydratase